jgi:outer membrane receptor protein involved in Fe transport
MKSFIRKEEGKKIVILIFAILQSLCVLQGQNQPKFSIKGQLKDQQNYQVVAFATVALRRLPDSTMVTGTSSNLDGEFIIGSIPAGKYSLIISSLEYTSVIRNIDLINDFNTGIVFLHEKSVTLGEVVVVSERMKAKNEADKTIYYMNKKMYDASSNGVEMLSYIPGVQVDIMKNISLEGSQHIVILVDGKERDRNFLSQLNSNQIDKVEVINNPGSKYDADVTGVINIILKKNKESGLNGQVHLEVPTSVSEMYIFPDYSFNYSFKKLNLFTSYDGDLSYFNIIESSDRNFHNSLGVTEIMSDQIVRQKYWSHRFHFGFDYNLDDKNQINFYAFYNPYSSEHSGKVKMQVSGDEFGDQNWSSLKQDADINRSSFYSLYYKHIFNKPGREIAFDLNYFNFNAVNSTTYITLDGSPDNFPAKQVNTVRPEQNSVSFKIDYSSPITEKLRYEAGIKVKSQLLQDRQSDEFKYNESIYALYGTITYNYSKFTLSTGIRAERSTSGLTGSFDNNVFALLPDAMLNYKLNPKQNIKFSYNRTVYRPNIYDLNPYTSSDDPYSVQSGNPHLKPEFRQNISVDYSKNIGNNFISLQLFYLDRSDAINHYTFINDTSIFETQVANLGNIHGYGIRMSGALKINKAIAMNPYIKLTEVYTQGNYLSEQYNIADRHKIAIETGLSAIVNFKYDIVASLQFQYSSPLINIQGLTFSDALYFVSLEKTFKQKIKIGITSALPFSKKFTYQGSEIKGADFYCHSEGNIRFSVAPVWFKFTYQFNSGKTLKRVNNSKEDIDSMPKKGF